MLRIDIEANPAQTFQVLLDGQECTISLFQRLGKMYLDLMVGDTVICQGAICQYGADILQFRTPYFKGSLRFYDTIGARAPEWHGVGSRYFLLYFSEGEEIPKELL